MRPARRRGVSLLELLAAIGVVALLMALLIPTLSAARRRSKVILCASNLRQIGQAMQTYRSEIRRWPAACPIPAPFTLPSMPVGPALPQCLAAYLPIASTVYRCPGDDDQVYSRCAASPGGCGVSYLYWLPFDFPKPSQTVMTDFQGYAGPTRIVNLSEFHPPRVGMNELKLDGSVDFGFARPDGPRRS